MPTTPHPVRQEVNLNRGAGRLFTGPPALRLVRSVVVKIAQSPLYLMALLLAAEGCFQYVPEGDVAPTRGSPIRVHLERPTSFELTQFTVNNVIRVDGEMVRREAGDVILSATWLDAVTGVGFAGEGWTLRIPETTVTALELKKNFVVADGSRRARRCARDHPRVRPPRYRHRGKRWGWRQRQPALT